MNKSCAREVIGNLHAKRNLERDAARFGVENDNVISRVAPHRDALRKIRLRTRVECQAEGR